MIRTFEATIDEQGTVRLLEDVHLQGAKRALVTILDDEPNNHPAETALLSEASLSEDSESTRGGRRVGSFAAGSVVLVRFPFSDLSQTKLRPAVVLANCGRGDWLLCQVTSNSYSDARAIEIADSGFRKGSLRITSYARPARLFTAHESLISGEVGILHDSVLKRITEAIARLIQH